MAILATENDLTIQLYRLIGESDEPRVFDSFHASSVAQCPKAQYMQRLGIATYSKPTGAKILRWRVGHLLEQEIRPALKKLYPNLLSNQRLEEPTLDLTGEYDNYDPDTEQLIEIKSVGPRAARYRKVTEDRHHLRDDKPYLGHQWQQHAYVLLLDRDHKRVKRVKSITYLYITLEGLLIPYTTEVDPDILEQVKTRLRALKTLWETQTPPKCLCSPDHPLWGSVMQFCPFSKPDQECCRMPG